MRAFALLLLSAILVQCNTIDLYEQTASIPQHAWRSDFKPSFTFEISDTSAAYQVSLILRHTDDYPFNNIWLEVGVDAPDSKHYNDTTELRLGNNEQGWLGTGLNDVYEHRIPLNAELFPFRKKGKYTFHLTQLMREDPLPNVLQVGIRVERKR